MWWLCLGVLVLLLGCWGFDVAAVGAGCHGCAGVSGDVVALSSWLLEYAKAC